ncbi:hypothetical protein SK128_002942, partial [Halocaridina rubra]
VKEISRMAFLGLQTLGTSPFIKKGIEFMWGRGKWGTYTAFAAVVAVGTAKVVGHIKRQNRR